MRKLRLVLFCALAACSTSASAVDASRLALIRTARSVASEAAATIDFDRRGRLLGTYVRAQLDDAADQLHSLADQARDAQPDVTAPIEAASQALAANDPAGLKAAVERLHALEEADVAAP